MYRNKALAIFTAVVVLSLVLAACAPPTPEKVEVTKIVEVTKEVPVQVVVTPTPKPEAKELTVYHWWTAGGERQAMDVIFKHFNAANPDIKIVDNPIPGGGGIALKTVMQGMLAAKMPPDTFQSLSGSELKMYVDGGFLEPIDDIWAANNCDTKYPAVIGKMVTFNGKKYGMPMNAHRANWLFYNVKLFNELGLKPPTDVDELIAAAKTIKEKKPDVYPIGLGSRDKWTAIFLFDVVLLSEGGPDVYEKFYTGQLDAATDPTIKAAMEKYAALVPYLYPYHGAKIWSDIPPLLGEGKIGMYVLGDFSAAQLVQAGYKEGTDWEAVAFPQKPEEVFLMIVDTFTRPVGIKHPDANKAWLNNLADPDTQAEFNIIKGSIAIHADVPATTYPDDLHRRASAAFKGKRIVPASAHGALAPQAFLSDWQDILTRFLYAPDVTRLQSETAQVMKTYDVAKNSEWYWAK